MLSEVSSLVSFNFETGSKRHIRENLCIKLIASSTYQTIVPRECTGGSYMGGGVFGANRGGAKANYP